MKRLTVIGFLAAALIAGCSHPPHTVVGKWSIDPAFISDNAGNASPEAIRSLSTALSFEFHADNTFHTLVTDGVYTFDGTRVVLVTTKVNGKDVTSPGPPTAGELSANGHTLTLHPPPGKGKYPDELKNGIPMIREKS